MPITSTEYRSAMRTVCRTARTCGAGRLDAEDALQTAALELLNLPVRPTNVAGWLAFRARLRLQDALRAARSRARTAEESLVADSSASSLDTRGADAWLRARAVERVGAAGALKRALALYDGPARGAQRVMRMRAARAVRKALGVPPC